MVGMVTEMATAMAMATLAINKLRHWSRVLAGVWRWAFFPASFDLIPTAFFLSSILYKDD
jgi:hypothetical protein